MPFYRPLSPQAMSGYPFSKPLLQETRKRAAEGLLRLREQFESDPDQMVPDRTLDETLLLATWNIREFDAGDKYQPRLEESIYYIAEILSHFDLIAVQEVRESLEPLERVLSVLGSWWKYIVTDVTYGARGNGERMAFIYDSRKVTFSGLAGEVILSPEQTKKGEQQLARTPFLCGFKAHWAKFNLCTVHLLYGSKDPDDPERAKEVKNLADLLKKYIAGPSSGEPGKTRAQENLILLGDFNIFTRGDATWNALKDAGFTVPDELLKQAGSNLDRTKFYDQIAFRVREGRFETAGKAGVFDFFKSVFRLEDEGIYAGLLGEKCAAKYSGMEKAGDRTRYYKDWRTFQMSDHLVLWVALKIDFGERYLEEAAGLAAPPQ